MVTKNGLDCNEWKTFTDLLIKANSEQIKKMQKLIRGKICAWCDDVISSQPEGYDENGGAICWACAERARSF